MTELQKVLQDAFDNPDKFAKSDKASIYGIEYKKAGLKGLVTQQNRPNVTSAFTNYLKTIISDISKDKTISSSNKTKMINDYTKLLEYTLGD